MLSARAAAVEAMPPSPRGPPDLPYPTRTAPPGPLYRPQYFMVVGFEVSPCSIARPAGKPVEDIICGLEDDSHITPMEITEGTSIVYTWVYRLYRIQSTLLAPPEYLNEYLQLRCKRGALTGVPYLRMRLGLPSS